MFNNLLLFRRTRVKGYYQKRVAGTAADGGERDAKRSTSVSKLPQRGALHRNWAVRSRDQNDILVEEYLCSGLTVTPCSNTLKSASQAATYLAPATRARSAVALYG